jgi:diguanylate cyclase (GGDEF)-like protein
MTFQLHARILLASRSTGLITSLQALPISGAQLDIASSGQEVVDALHHQEDLCLALLDADLPGMDIGQLLALVRAEKKGRTFPIVLLQQPLAPERLRSVVRAFGHGPELAPPPDSSVLDTQTDPLTGLYTRAALLSMLFRETDRVQRMKTPLSVMLFGMDDFEGWKVRLTGAPWGEVLRQMVERVRRLLRSYDLFGRTGECEFVLGLPGCGVNNAVSLSKRIRGEVFSAPFSASGASIRLTAGFGIALSEGRSPVVVLREAEQELKKAQAAGPDSIRVRHQRH